MTPGACTLNIFRRNLQTLVIS